MPETHSVVGTTDNFKAEVLDFPGVVLVDFWATWCGPCRAMAPRIAEIAEKYAENDMVKIVEIDVDKENALSNEYQVLSIPTYKVFAKGEAVDRRIGLIPTSELETIIQTGLAAL